MNRIPSSFQIYEKICDLTGESKYAERIVKKPISFKATAYPEFNKTIEKLINKSNAFPDFRDILKCLDFCNKKHTFKLKPDDMKKIASDAFQKVGEVLQKRRKTDFYETVSYFVGAEEDPALKDNLLKIKLDDNKKHYAKINDVIQK